MRARDIPVIDIEPLINGDLLVNGDLLDETASLIRTACKEVGFFYIVGHGIDPTYQDNLDALAREFFALPGSDKAEIAMPKAGRAWRGWFPVGGELTSGVPDNKEGIYFGQELGEDHPRVRAGTPLHGANLFPVYPERLKSAVLEHIAVMTRLAERVLSGIARSLGLAPNWFSDRLTKDPLVLFRIFSYPAFPEAGDRGWSVGEHTDYGLLTIVAQDASGGLEVKTPSGWIEVPPVRDAFVCNLGDMLERLTGGLYRSTLHRVRNRGNGERLSFPFFYDPSWDAKVDRLPIIPRPEDHEDAKRWDNVSVHGFEGTYGEYILAKVGKVFPGLSADSTCSERESTEPETG